MKKIISTLLIIAISLSLFASSVATFSAVNTETSEKGKYCLGDIDMNNKISILDATALQKYLAKSSVFNHKQQKLADIDDTSGLQISDVTLIQLYIAKISRKYPSNTYGYTIGEIVEFADSISTLPIGIDLNTILKTNY